MLHFTDALLTRRPPTGIDVVTTLRHFAIITYRVDPAQLQIHLHPRFVPETIVDEAGKRWGLISVVPFLDSDFHFVRFPYAKFVFGQTNYRAYVIDSVTKRRAVWFFGTCLDSWSHVVPRYLWKLPWHNGRIRFECAYDDQAARYDRYRMTTTSRWAPADVILSDSGVAVSAIAGFASLEHGLVVLTHPLDGYYYRRDGSVGHYRIWHDRLHMTVGHCIQAAFPLLASLGLVLLPQQQKPHAVFLQHETTFTVYLPPQAG